MPKLEHMEGCRRSSSVGADMVGQSSGVGADVVGQSSGVGADVAGQSSAECLGNCPDEAQAESQPDAQSGAVMLALARSDVGSARAGWGADGAQTMQKNLAFSCNDLYLPD